MSVGCSPAAGRPPPVVPTTPALPWESQPAVAHRVDSPVTALVGGTVMTAHGPEFPDGVVVFANGRIEAVGARGSVDVPAGARVVDVTGRFVTPGIIDAHSHMGVYSLPSVAAHADGNEATHPVTAQVRAEDSFWPQDPALSHALASGVTAALVLPGSANLVGGQGVTVKLLPGLSVAEMKFPGAPRTLKMACGENPKRVYGERKRAPSTRMGSVAADRAAFQRALEYRAKFTRWQSSHRRWQTKAAGDAQQSGPPPSMPARDFGLEALLGVLEDRVLLQMHCYRADDMLAMLELAAQFGLSVRAFHHGIEAYKIRDVLAQRGVGIATWADWWGFKMEAYDMVRENLGLLSLAGVPAALHSDSPSLVQRLNQEAAKALAAALKAGLSVDRNAALAWITLNAAWVLGIDSLTGSLEPGKMADVVVWSEDPFSVYSRVEAVYVDGRLQYHRVRRPRRPSDFELGQAQPSAAAARLPRRVAP